MREKVTRLDFISWQDPSVLPRDMRPQEWFALCNIFIGNNEVGWAILGTRQQWTRGMMQERRSIRAGVGLDTNLEDKLLEDWPSAESVSKKNGKRKVLQRTEEASG